MIIGVKMDNIDFIISADIHARNTVPKCRTDNFIFTFLKKLVFLNQLQEKYNCPILDGGDVFDTYEVSAELEALTIEYCPELITIPGNHDLKDHSLPYFFKSSLNVLRKAKKVKVLINRSLFKDSEINDEIKKEIESETWFNEYIYKDYRIIGIPYGYEIDNSKNIYPQPGKINVVIIHDMVYYNDPTYANGKPIGTNAKLIMKQLKDFDLIISGHNHQSFIVKSNKQTLINAGSMMRTTANQVDHIPGVFLWKNDQTFDFVPYPIEKNVISLEHIKLEHEKNERIESYIEQLKMTYEVGLNFKKNLETFLLTNDLDPIIPEYIKNMKGYSK